MAEEEEQAAEESEESGGGGKSPILLILIVALVSLGIGGGGAYFVFGGEKAPAAEEGAEGEGEEPVVEESDAAFAERVYSLEPFVVNVSGEGYPRYLKLKIELETDGPEAVEDLDARLAQVRDTIILMLSSKRLADISDFEGKALLKDDLRDRINGLLEHGQVEQVLFTEFVVQ